MVRKNYCVKEGSNFCYIIFEFLYDREETKIWFKKNSVIRYGVTSIMIQHGFIYNKTSMYLIN